MTQSLILKCKGLNTNPNDLSAVPDGSLIEAENIYIDRDDIAQPRRGFNFYGSAFGISSTRAKAISSYKNLLLRHYGTTLSYDSSVSPGTFTDYSTSVTEPDSNAKVRFIEMNGNLYFTTDSGIKKLDTIIGPITNSGGIKALDVNLTLNAATGFFTDNTEVAYRVVWGYKDLNNNVILGTPSERAVISNSSGSSATVDLDITVPDGVTVNHFYQIYRSDLSSGSSVDPGDELKLAFEGNPTSLEITNKLIAVTDITPQVFLGDFLYTNETQQGILKANEIPPFAKDIAPYKNVLFFGNTRTKHRLNLSLLSVSNFVAGTSQLTFTSGSSSFTLTFDTSENTATGDVLISVLATPGQEVDESARSLVRVINRYSANTFLYAYYLSGPDDVPGQILLEARDLSATPFSITANSSSTGEEFNPVIPTTGTTVISDNEVKSNRLYYSKYQQPEAVPLLNYFDIGAQDNEITRILPLRDSLFIFKSDGIYRISGDTADNFQVTLFDGSTTLTARESPAIGNNQIFMLSEQGIVKVSESAVQIISRGIEDQILNLNSPLFTNYNSATFGFYYNTERKYYLSTVKDMSDVYATQAFAFNVFTNAWTKLPITKSCGYVNPTDNKLYFGAGDLNVLEQERKSFTYRDFADREYTGLIGAQDGTVINLTTSATVEAGDVIAQTVYLTPYKFNRVLAQLDIDPALEHNYVSTLLVSNKSELKDAILALATKLDNDPGTSGGYVAVVTGATTPSGIQSDFNAVVAHLNADPKVVFSNYQTSTSTDILENTVLSVSGSEVTLELDMDYDLASCTIYKAIATKITWAPCHAGDPSVLKQFSETNLMFSDIVSNVVSLSFRSDIQQNYDKIEFPSNSTGGWGDIAWGDDPWGGYSGPRAFRTYVPRGKQRCRFLNPKFEHKRAYENYLLVGLSLTFDVIQQRVGR